MDTRTHIPYHTRARDLRIAIQYSRAKFGRLLGMDPNSVNRLEKGKKRLNLPQIRRLRIMERAFQEHLNEYYKVCKKFNCKYPWGREEKFYSTYDGRTFVKKLLFYRSSHILPSRQEDIEALGGLEAFGVTPLQAERLRRGRPILCRSDEAKTRPTGELITPRRSKLGGHGQVSSGRPANG